jgi:hypothetical protein
MNVTDKHVAENKAAIDKNIKNKLIRTEVLATIDDLNQYLNGNVTKTGLQITLSELINKL